MALKDEYARGQDCILTVAGSVVGPIQTLSMDDTMTEHNVGSREAPGFTATQPGKRSISFSVDCLEDFSNAGFAALSNAYINRSKVTFKIETENGYGVEGSAYFFSRSQSQPEDGPVMFTFSGRNYGTFTEVTPAS